MEFSGDTPYMSVVQIQPEQIEALRAQPGCRLLDVRTDAERARGLLAGSEHVVLNQLPQRWQELDPAAPLIIYCQSGARSYQACAYLQERGFASVYNLQGGILAWQRAGLPVDVPSP